MSKPRQLLRNREPVALAINAFFGVFLSITEIVYVVLIVWTFWILRQTPAAFTKRTHRLHRQLTLLLAVQAFLPLMMGVYPAITSVVKWYLPPSSNHVQASRWTLAFAANPAIASLLSIFFITPYREFLLGGFRSKLSSRAEVSVSMAAGSRPFVVTVGNG
ncbi:hypothetical protein M3Y99_00761000 [Aphelenchoides fujianensis]|nr:hypothetical protein M3Y99_00761000 [Aphelenchoides fujianensis]